MSHGDFSPFRYSSAICLFACLFAGTAIGGNVPDARETLDPQKSVKVREVGNVLLQAKRSHRPDESAMQIRQQIDQVRKGVESLTKPLPVSELTLAEDGLVQRSRMRGANGMAISDRSAWHHARRLQIRQLKNDLATLRNQRGAFKAKAQTVSPKTLQRARGPASIAEDVRRAHPALTDVSERALDRLVALENEVDAALAAPADERHRRLTTLAQKLRFRKQAVNMGETRQKDTPTYITRTRHR